MNFSMQQWCRNWIFGWSVNPIHTGKGRLSPTITTGTPKVFHLPASLLLIHFEKIFFYLHDQNKKYGNISWKYILLFRNSIKQTIQLYKNVWPHRGFARRVHLLDLFCAYAQTREPRANTKHNKTVLFSVATVNKREPIITEFAIG